MKNDDTTVNWLKEKQEETFRRIRELESKWNLKCTELSMFSTMFNEAKTYALLNDDMRREYERNLISENVHVRERAMNSIKALPDMEFLIQDLGFTVDCIYSFRCSSTAETLKSFRSTWDGDFSNAWRFPDVMESPQLSAMVTDPRSQEPPYTMLPMSDSVFNSMCISFVGDSHMDMTPVHIERLSRYCSRIGWFPLYVLIPSSAFDMVVEELLDRVRWDSCYKWPGFFGMQSIEERDGLVLIKFSSDRDTEFKVIHEGRSYPFQKMFVRPRFIDLVRPQEKNGTIRRAEETRLHCGNEYAVMVPHDGRVRRLRTREELRMVSRKITQRWGSLNGIKAPALIVDIYTFEVFTYYDSLPLILGEGYLAYSLVQPFRDGRELRKAYETIKKTVPTRLHLRVIEIEYDITLSAGASRKRMSQWERKHFLDTELGHMISAHGSSSPRNASHTLKQVFGKYLTQLEKDGFGEYDKATNRFTASPDLKPREMAIFAVLVSCLENTWQRNYKKADYIFNEGGYIFESRGTIHSSFFDDVFGLPTETIKSNRSSAMDCFDYRTRPLLKGAKGNAIKVDTVPIERIMNSVLKAKADNS